jgi:hypothetical protein
MSDVSTVVSIQDIIDTDDNQPDQVNFNSKDLISVYCTNMMCSALYQSTHKNHIGEFCWGCRRGVTYPRGLYRLNWSSFNKKDDYKHGEIPSFLIDIITLDEWDSILNHIDCVNYCDIRKIPTSFQMLTQSQWNQICNNLIGVFPFPEKKYLNPDFLPSMLTDVLTLNEWQCICEKYNTNINVYIQSDNESDDDLL